MKPSSPLSLSLVLCVAMAPCLATAADATPEWPDFRGPTQDGIVSAKLPDGSPRTLPLEWDQASGKGIVWKAAIHGAGHSTPVILGDQLWFTTATEDGRDMSAIGVNRKDGTIFFDKVLFHNSVVEPLGNPVNNYAAPSPVIEAGRVYIHFGSYGTACLDTKDGATLWERRDLPCRHYRGPGSSPVLFENLLILTMDGVDQQYMVALDKTTGKTVWRTDRSTVWTDIDKDGKPIAEGDFRKAYATPLLVKGEDGKSELITISSKNGFTYDPATGKELWKFGHAGFSNASRPVLGAGLVFLNSGFSKATLHAVKYEPGMSGDLTATHEVWQRNKNIPNKPSPVLVGDYLFMADDGGMASCLRAKDGEEIWRERLEGTRKFSGSPIACGGRVYFCDEAGMTVVVAAEPVFKVLASNQLAEGIHSSPAVAGNELYLRTSGHLYRLETN